MGIHTTDVIVLRRYLYRETSVIVSCLSERYGKFRGLVKGLRMYPNRHRSAMEPLTINRLVFYDTRDSQIHLISQCELIAPLSTLQQDLDTVWTASACVELLEAIVPLEEPQPALYHLLKETLERLALGAAPALLHMSCIARALRLAGFQPQLDHCTACHAFVEQTAWWSAKQGGLLCGSCRHEDPSAEAADAGMLTALAALSESKALPPLEPSMVSLLRRRLTEFLHWRLDRPLKTMNYFAESHVMEPIA